MSGLLTSLGGFLSSNSKSLNSLLGLAGAGTNLFSGIQQVQEQNRLAGAQKYVTDLMTNPAKMSAARAAYTQPLNAGLTSDITNQVQANLAERGLGSSPAAYTQQLTAALAPYIQQNQQAGMQDLLAALGLSGNLRSTAPQFQDISKLLAQLKLPAQPPQQFSSLFGSADPLDLNVPQPIGFGAPNFDLSAVEA